MIVHGRDLITTGPGQRHGGPLPAEQRWMCVVSLKVAVARYQAAWSLAINKSLLALASCTVGHTEPHKKGARGSKQARLDGTVPRGRGTPVSSRRTIFHPKSYFPAPYFIVR